MRKASVICRCMQACHWPDMEISFSSAFFFSVLKILLGPVCVALPAFP